MNTAVESSGIEVTGRTLHALHTSLGNDAAPLLAAYGLHHVQAETWYPYSIFRDILAEIEAHYATATLVRIGMNIPTTWVYPLVESLGEALFSLDALYQANHRGPALGGYEADQRAERTIRMVHTTPYPTEFEYGILCGIAQRYRPTDSMGVRVLRQDSPSRKYGDAFCIYTVTW